jgi:transcriptional regulator with XRE-family HTH domain
MTQMQLAERIGVSYQQIQKYERGGSRVTVDRLQQIANALGTDTLALISDTGATHLADGTAGYAGGKLPGEITREEMQLLRLFAKIASPALRRQILRLVQSIVDQQSPPRA